MHGQLHSWSQSSQAKSTPRLQRALRHWLVSFVAPPSSKELRRSPQAHQRVVWKIVYTCDALCLKLKATKGSSCLPSCACCNNFVACSPEDVQWGKAQHRTQAPLECRCCNCLVVTARAFPALDWANLIAKTRVDPVFETQVQSVSVAKPAEVRCEVLWWNLICLMWNIWWNLGGGLFDLPGKHQKFRGEFLSKFWQIFRRLRFKFFVFFRKLRSAEGRCVQSGCVHEQEPEDMAWWTSDRVQHTDRIHWEEVSLWLRGWIHGPLWHQTCLLPTSEGGDAHVRVRWSCHRNWETDFYHYWCWHVIQPSLTGAWECLDKFTSMQRRFLLRPQEAAARSSRARAVCENNFDNSHPHITRKYAPTICHKMRGRMTWKSLEIKGLSQRMWCTNRLLWHMNCDFYSIRIPTFTLYEPFYCGCGVVFNMLSLTSTGRTGQLPCPRLQRQSAMAAFPPWSSWKDLQRMQRGAYMLASENNISNVTIM